jgi:hypothetical protein
MCLGRYSRTAYDGLGWGGGVSVVAGAARMDGEVAAAAEIIVPQVYWAIPCPTL